LSLATSVADIRVAYMQTLGVPTLAAPFIGISGWPVSGAVAASTWAAHPFRAEFRKATGEVSAATRNAKRARGRAYKYGAAVNELAERLPGLVAESAATAQGILFTGLRQGWIYRRSVLLGSVGSSQQAPTASSAPEPTSLFAQPTDLDLPREIHELLDPAHRSQDFIFAPLKKADLEDLDDAAWAFLQKQLEHADEINREAEDRGGGQRSLPQTASELPPRA
jgi:hypothetical protein